MDYFRALVGLLAILLIAYLFSEKKKAINWRLVAGGMLLQITIGLLLLKITFFESVFKVVSSLFVTFLGFAINGSEFLFGKLATNSFGVIFAFQVLPVIIFFSAVTAGLYYLGVLQKIVFVMARVMTKAMKLSGAESLSAAGNVFLGQTEAPLLVRPFIPSMTRSEIMCLMTGGMATIAGSVLGAYVTYLGGADVEEQSKFAAFLLTASLMNAPAAIVASKILVPEQDYEKLNTQMKVTRGDYGVNLLDAITRGAGDGLKLALNVAAMLLVFVAIIAALNFVLAEGIGSWTGLNDLIAVNTNGLFDKLSLEYILGQVFRVLAFVMGVDWQDTLAVGSLLGQKTVINEFIAYTSLAEMKGTGLLSQKSIVIATFVLCGFSNFSSIAIQIGGIGGMAPNQQGLLSKLGMKALVAATIACMLTATIAGALVN